MPLISLLKTRITAGRFNVWLLLFSLVLGSSMARAQFSYELYYGSYTSLPDFSLLAPASSGATNIISVAPSDVADNYALVFSRQITVDVAGTYFFAINSADGSRLYIDNNLVVDNDGLHGTSIVVNSIVLPVGSYDLRVEYFQNGGESLLDVAYWVDGNPFAPIPADGLLNGQVFVPEEAGQWGSVISWPHVAVSAANLPDGRVLTWSSTEVNTFPTVNEFTYASVFDPLTNQFIDVNSNFHDMFCAGISLLEDGTVVASGGNPFDRRTSAFDPNALQWSPLADMLDVRWYGTNVTLPNNQIFSTWARGSNNRTELYNPVTDIWVRSIYTDMQTLVNEQNAINNAPNPANSLNFEWWAHLAVTPEGKVFQGGPTQTFHNFDPVAGTTTDVLGKMAGDRARMYGNAVTYDVGKVLLVGGSDRTEVEPTSIDNVYLVDLNGPTPVVTPGPAMHYPRALSNAITLPNGEVLVIGGNTSGKIFSDEGSVLPSEIYNPQTNTWTLVDAIDVPRNYHSIALLLKDGRVLSAGGGLCGQSCGVNHLDGQIYSPTYLFNPDGSAATRPNLSNVPNTATAGQTIVVSASNDTDRFSMVRLSGTTHHLNTDQRFVPVSSVDNGDGTFSLTMNANPNVLIQGYYFLFAVNANGTPSIAETIQILRVIDPNADDDNDGVINTLDAFPNDPAETQDSDGDGVGDNADAFPSNNAETQDSDGDGVGNNTDPTPYGPGGYRYYRFTPTKLRDDVGADSVQLAELAFFSMGERVLNATVTNPGGDNPEFQTTAEVNDSDIFTKWTDSNRGALIYDFGQLIAIDGYAITTARDESESDPVRWTLESSNDQLEWTMIDDQSGQDVAVPLERMASLQTIPVALVRSPITPLPELPRNSTTIIVETSTGQDRIWNVNPDNDTVSVIDSSGTLLSEIPVGDNPWALSKRPGSDRVFVTNKLDATVSVINTQTLAVVQTHQLPYASQPHGLVFSGDGSNYFVILEALAQVQQRNADTGALNLTTQLSGKPRHLAITFDDGQLLVSNFITPPIPGENTNSVDVANGAAEVFVVDPVSMSWVDTITLSHDDRSLSESQGPGMPNYLHAPVVSFDNLQAYIPSKKDNVSGGPSRGSIGMTFESTVRAQGTRVLLASGIEDNTFRVDFDNASLATGAALTGEGRYLLVALETSRELVVYDIQNNVELMRLPTGRAPQGVALASDGSMAYVHNFMDRSISHFDLTEIIETELPSTDVIGEYSVVTVEALTAQILQGKQFFYDAFDDRMARDNYMSCASCHKEGDSDGRVWDLSGLGEGIRNTISLRGKGGAQGRLHWTQNFDEVQDFENQIRFLNAGLGLMDQADFDATSDTLGAPKAGLSADLDALAAYVESLVNVPASPHRNSDGSMTADAVSGESIYTLNNCGSCHSGNNFTGSDSLPLIDIGTITAASGLRLGAVLEGIDVPSLRGIWESPPYLHDGSAQTLTAAVQAHSGVSLSNGDMTLLVEYLKQLDQQNSQPQAVPVALDQNIELDENDQFNIILYTRDANNDPLTYTLVTSPQSGSLSGTEPDVVYTPDPGFAGYDSFSFYVTDNLGNSNTATISIFVQDDFRGDPDGDGRVTVADLVLLQRHLLGLTSLNSEQVSRLDLYPAEADGELTVSDLLVLQSLL